MMTKEAALEVVKQIGLAKSGKMTAAFRDGFVNGYLTKALPPEQTIVKLAERTGIPDKLIKMAMVKKAIGPLGLMIGGYALSQLPGALRAGWRYMRPGLGSGITSSHFGGFAPGEAADFEKLVTRMALLNAETQGRQQKLRWAMNPMGGGAPFMTSPPA